MIDGLGFYTAIATLRFVHWSLDYSQDWEYYASVIKSIQQLKCG